MDAGSAAAAPTAVALLAEGVGRNVAPSKEFLVYQVALLAEGVGRNMVRLA